MGCQQPREKIDEDYLSEVESKLRFPEFTVKEIKQAFCHASGAASVSLLQIEKFIKNLRIEYSPNARTNIFDTFVKQFEIGEDTYDLNELLIAIFLLTKSSTEEKGLELFDIFERRSAGCLYKEEARTAFYTICDVVCRYSEGFLDQDEEIKAMHCEISDRKRNDIIVPKLVEFFLQGREYIRYENFKIALVKATQVPDLLDLTSPLSIRKIMMDYLYLPFKSKRELEGVYDARKSKTKHAFTRNGSPKSTITNSPSRSFMMKNGRNTRSEKQDTDCTI